MERVRAACLCGCGLPAPIAKTTRRRAGYRKGDVLRFRRGHAHRVGHGYGTSAGYRRP
jgi:hypothetical protein